MVAQEPVLQINLGLTNEIISRYPIPVHHGHSNGMVHWESGWKLKHLAKNRIELARDVVVFVIDGVLS